MPNPGSRTSAHVIGRGTRISGNVSGAEDLVVEGHVGGRVQLAGRLTVASGAVIEADVEADSLAVAGEITGDVTVHHTVQVLAGGRILGDVQAARVAIADGGRIDGTVDMKVDLPPALTGAR